MCYAWKPIRGYSAFGQYKSNNYADGPKIFTGFRPAFIIFKMASAAHIGDITITKEMVLIQKIII